MTALTFSLILLLSSLAAGLLGALTGLGGGVVIVPVLTIFFDVDIHYAIGASLVSVIATSSGAAAAYVREGFSNIRIGMFLEIATTLGALRCVAHRRASPPMSIAIIFGLVLLYSAYVLASAAPRKHAHRENPIPSPLRLKLNGSYPASRRRRSRTTSPSASPPASASCSSPEPSPVSSASAPAPSKSSPWTRPCACPSRSPPPPAIS